jgi:hypothetical protein
MMLSYTYIGFTIFLIVYYVESSIRQVDRTLFYSLGCGLLWPIFILYLVCSFAARRICPRKGEKYE